MWGRKFGELPRSLVGWKVDKVGAHEQVAGNLQGRSPKRDLLNPTRSRVRGFGTWPLGSFSEEEAAEEEKELEPWEDDDVFEAPLF